jgi:hypothetical protein
VTLALIGSYLWGVQGTIDIQLPGLTPEITRIGEVSADRFGVRLTAHCLDSRALPCRDPKLYSVRKWNAK